MKQALNDADKAVEDNGESIFGKKHSQRHIHRTWLPHTGDLNDPGRNSRLEEEELEDQNFR